MGTRDTYQRTVLNACIVAGDEVELARRLGVPVEKVVGWILGHESLPNDVFLHAVDIVLTSHRQHSVAVNVFLEEMKRRYPIKPPRA